MNAAKVNSKGQQSSLTFLKENDTIRLALTRAVFDRVKKVFFTLPMKNVNQTVLQSFH